VSIVPSRDSGCDEHFILHDIPPWNVPSIKAYRPFQLPRISNNEKYKDIFFAKVDVDQLPELSDELGILAMPTFLLFKDGERAGELVDPKPDTFVELVGKGL